jgi:hypothetical protein
MMPHGHESGEFCPVCKILIDCGGAITAATLALAAASQFLQKEGEHGIMTGVFDEDQIEELSAWSQLQCNRAALIQKWATETLAYGQRLAGVYTPSERYIVNGIDGITET